ncbi:STAS domain-containing protein [Kitasatospora sp. NPDC094015]|uniref:STAS domain-containing protein n=1 Tax=Kitasatospora sp. NPDC094015 TaxID=3155205 RepID=UPI0033226CED
MTTALVLTPGHGPDGSPVLRAVGEIDLDNAHELAAAIDRTPESDPPLTIDLSAVEYLDSAGLTVLFARADRIRLVTSRLLNPLLAVSGLARIVTVHNVDDPPDTCG